MDELIVHSFHHDMQIPLGYFHTTEQYLVLDLWTSTCVKCPAALERFAQNARTNENRSKFVFACINLDNFVGACQAAEDEEFVGVYHLYANKDVKDQIKLYLPGLKQVPYYIIIGPNGELAYYGNEFPDLDTF